jgi:hypothetical protein
MEPKLMTLGELLLTHSPAVLAKAIEKHGLYGWDEFGVWGEFKKKTETVSLALKKLSEVYYAMIEAARNDPPKSWHGVLTGKNLVGPLHHLGWLHGQMPDFQKISKELSGEPVFMPIDSPKMRDSTAISIISCLLSMVKGQDLQGSENAPVTQAAVIEHLTKRYADFPGISKSNLENVFSEANSFLNTFGTFEGKSAKSKSKLARRP